MAYIVSSIKRFNVVSDFITFLFKKFNFLSSVLLRLYFIWRPDVIVIANTNKIIFYVVSCFKHHIELSYLKNKINSNKQKKS